METGEKNRLIEAFEEWAQDRGLLTSLPMLRQGALRLLDDAGEAPLTAATVEEILGRAEAAGTNAATIAQLRQIGQAFVEFARPFAGRPPARPAVPAARSVAPAAIPPVAKAVAAPAATPPADVPRGPVSSGGQRPTFKPIPVGAVSAEKIRAAGAQPDSPSPNAGAVVGALVLALALVGGLRWLLVQPITPTTAAHFVMADKGFAVIPPSGWARITPELVEDAKKRGVDVPREVERALFDKNVVAAFTQGFSQQGFPPSFNVVVIDQKLPPINEAARKEATEQLEKLYQNLVRSYHVKSSAITTVDRVKALEISGLSTLRIDRIDIELRTHQILIPGKNASFFLTFTGLEKDFEDLRDLSRSVLQSFVIMNRPPRFQPIFQTAILSGLLGGLIPLLFFLGRAGLWFATRSRTSPGS